MDKVAKKFHQYFFFCGRNIIVLRSEISESYDNLYISSNVIAKVFSKVVVSPCILTLLYMRTLINTSSLPKPRIFRGLAVFIIFFMIDVYISL